MTRTSRAATFPVSDDDSTSCSLECDVLASATRMVAPVSCEHENADLHSRNVDRDFRRRRLPPPRRLHDDRKPRIRTGPAFMMTSDITHSIQRERSSDNSQR